MNLAPGTRLGSYEIMSALGAGGMGEVYRAHDTKLNRDVAIKSLLPAVTHDPGRLARFSREARVLASLNHPNIAQVYGLEESDGTSGLVMELVEGPTLAERIVGPPIPLDEALRIAKQIAEALEAAHEQGIVHRDLKPANIKIAPGGTVKVLDFGLAKIEATSTSEALLASSPTVTAPTRCGVILGTAAYMSPEQAAGEAVDRRSDLWSFGVVLLEMLTGRPVFAGESLSQVLAAVLRADVDFGGLPAATPPSIRKLLRRCLERDRKRRIASAGDARLEIEEALAPASTGDVLATADAAVGSRGWRRSVAVSVAAGLVLAGAAALVTWMAMRPVAATPMRFAVVSPASAPMKIGGAVRDFALSTDGVNLVYTAGPRAQLMLRSLDRLDARPVGDVVGATGPFFSPDGRWIGYFAGVSGELRRVSLAGGAPIPICRFTGSPRGASWGPDDVIYFATNEPTTGLLRVSAGGGKAETLTTPDSARGMEEDHLFPSVLPGGRALLFLIASVGSDAAAAQVAVLDLKTGRRKALIRGGSQPEYVETGHLLYTASGSLRAIRFDPSTLEVVGDPVTVVDQVMTLVSGAADFSVSRDGMLAYLPGGVETHAPRMSSLVWVTRQGREEAIAAPPRAYLYARLSPDGTRAGLSVGDEKHDLWTWDFARKTLTRQTFDPARDWNPGWSPDGSRILFFSARDGGVPHMFSRLADGTGSDQQLTSGAHVQFGSPSMSPDGKRVVFTEVVPGNGKDVAGTSEDIMMLTLDGTPHTEPLIQTIFAERNAQISPDGHWLAYESNESGQEEVYVTPFPNVRDGRWQISDGGGTNPIWGKKGGELFYRDGRRVMSASVQATPTFSNGTPALVFEGPYLSGFGSSYDVSPDGQRFLMIKAEGAGEQRSAPAVVVVLNWFEELKAKFAGRP